MNTWIARGLAWALGLCSLALHVAGIVFLYVDRDATLPDTVIRWSASDVFDSVVALGVPILGILIVNKQPRNAVGWVFVVAGVAIGLGGFGQAYAVHALVADPGSLPGGRMLAWLSNVLWPITITCLVLLFLLFPTGHLVSPPWRIVLGVTLAAFLVLTVGAVTIATSNWDEPFQLFDVDPATASVSEWAILLGALTMPVVLGLSAVSIVLRFRRSTGKERLQLTWFVSAAAVAAVSFSVGFFVDSAVVQVVVSFTLLGLYAAIGIAMVKHNLYDFDLLLSKAIAYGGLAAAITAIYVVVVVLVGAVIGVTEGLSLVATAVVAVAFQPIRRRAQRFANRLVYGQRATPYEVLSRFSEQVGETYSGEDILERMVRLLADGTGADSAAVWLRVGDELRPVATCPVDGMSEAIRLADGNPPAFDDVTAAVRVRHRGEWLGMLTVVKSPHDPLTPVEESLLTDLAGQAGMVLANSKLIEDLRASRQRLVAAQDEERRRIERNLHDGAQQQLVALATGLHLARRTASKDQAAADELLERLEGEVGDALETLRDLARGVYPALLADQGLIAAIEAQARRAPIPVRVDDEGIGRYTAEVEAAVYFCTLEALQNAAKYARPQQVVVRVGERDGALTFTIADDGVGFDQATTPLGSGLQNMADRLAALGGELHVRSSPGAGTSVDGRLPVGRRADGPIAVSDRARPP